MMGSENPCWSLSRELKNPTVVYMPVYKRVGTLISLSFQSTAVVYPTKNTHNLFPQGTLNLKGIC
ncbi:hypothetical protein MXB_1704 [Myxobolus squamalis]|nr:hypothetical protein MXB_1704 [Myxobolus squamalis]